MSGFKEEIYSEFESQVLKLGGTKNSNDKVSGEQVFR